MKISAPFTASCFRVALPVLLCATLLLAPPAFAAETGGAKKADFLSEKEQLFIRPGLEFDIESASVADDGVVEMRFSLRDRRGAPLDFAGVDTPGPLTIRAVLAYLPAGERLYTAYTTRMQTSPITSVTEEQAAFEQVADPERVGEGEYVYRFNQILPDDADLTATHTVAAWAQRDLSDFDLETEFDADAFDWVPEGGGQPRTTLSTSDAQCNSCHGELEAHDNRTQLALCVTCHQPQSVDPDTGNSVDMATMTHKIHMGEDLPSVQAGEPYQIIGFRQSVHDYSHVVYPADVRNCETCHVEDLSALPAALREQGAGGRIGPLRSRASARAPQAALSAVARQEQQEPLVNYHLLNPSRRACGSCHEDVNFATGEGHADLPQLSDNQCSRCHIPAGEIPFDVSILGSHVLPKEVAALPGTVFEILNVTNTAPGQSPTVEFAIRNDADEPVAPSEMGRLALVLAGVEGGDFSHFWSEDATGAAGSNGVYTYTFQEAAIPEDAAGTFAVGVEGYQTVTLLPGTVQERTVRDAGQNEVFRFDVGGGPIDPRRQIVTTENCNSCHFSLSFHGDNRNEVEQCVLCHNPNVTDARRRPEDQGAAESVNFKELIHRIHAGERQIRDFTVFGFGNRPHNYNNVEYPRSLAECQACHLEGTAELPLPADLLPTVDPRGLIDPALPATGACLSCHAQVSAAAHADLNISPSFGESCDVCHGVGAEFSVEESHAQ